MSMVERRIIFIIAKNPKLIISVDRNKNNPLIRKYSHIPFNHLYFYIKTVTDDYDNITDFHNITFINMTLCKCANNDKNINIIIPTLLCAIPCGISFLCLMSLMV